MGIGRGIALELAKAGYDIAIHYTHSADPAQKTAAEAEALGVKAVTIKSDLTSKSGVDSLFSEFSRNFDHLDLYVNNAGVTKTSDFPDLPEADFKAGLSHLSRHAAVELARHKIRVNTISPGWIDTKSPRLAPKESTYYKIPLKRWVEPSEIGKTVLFLDSPAAASITGAEIVMDGGASLMSDLPEKYGL